MYKNANGENEEEQIDRIGEHKENEGPPDRTTTGGFEWSELVKG